MSDSFFGELSVIGMRGCEKFVDQVDFYLREWRSHDDEITFIAKADCPRFGTGEGKGLLHDSMRGHDVYIISDCFNYGVTYRMYGREVPMSPDDHFADLKRTIAAIAGKARRITVIMPMLYEGRQHKRSTRESLDCAIALQELTQMGVSNIITFDAHDPRVSNAIPLTGFDNVRPTYQMLKAMVRSIPDISLNHDETMIIAPDEGAMSRTMYYASVMGLELGMPLPVPTLASTTLETQNTSSLLFSDRLGKPCLHPPSLWRNRLARSAVNRKVGGSSPPRDERQRFLIFETDLSVSHRKPNSISTVKVCKSPPSPRPIYYFFFVLEIEV